MPRYQSFDPEAEISGQTALSLITNIMHSDIAGILKRHQLEQIDPEAWYPIQSVLDVLSDISEGTNGSANLVSLGMASAKTVYENFPQEIRDLSLVDFLSNYNDLMRQVDGSRGDSNEIVFEQLNPHHMTVSFRVPYPDDVFYGFFYGMVRYFRPLGKGFSVKYDENKPRREEGGNSTTLHITIDR